ncbi:MAG: SET domain-containing protein-lysine N-methyltransferase, partial [Desulfuromonadaceae bacterium]|nr:SET domain-containing protein-lysine N-methyltransferase [Desulfuromonadaceae bacterium]
MVYNTINSFGEMGLFAKENFNSDDVIFSKTLTSLLDQPDKFSIQVDHNNHFNPNNEVLAKTNHSCAPNTKITYGKRTIKLVALKSVSIDEELTFNYLTTEYTLANPFKCNCGSIDCFQDIRGYRDLSPSQKQSLQPYVLNYLKGR